MARELGLSVRTLQRRLTNHNTSFEGEVRQERMKVAERLLAETETAITTIALDLGFATAQHFATSFNQHAGETPTAFRSRRQRT